MTRFLNDLKIAARSLRRAKGMSATVIVTLALGIGANAAIFTLVRGVLLRPLVNRDESRLVYIRQSDPAEGIDDAAFSVPEILVPPAPLCGKRCRPKACCYVPLELRLVFSVRAPWWPFWPAMRRVIRFVRWI